MLASERRTPRPGHRPTILQIVPRLDTGGAELTTIEIVEAIVRAGGRALVVTAGGRMADAIGRRGGELVAMAADTKNPITMLANAGRLADIIARESVDIVHARSRAPAWSALLAARRTKRAFVTTYHGAYAEKDSLKRLYNSVMARGDLVIANSHYTAGLVSSRYGLASDRIRVIHRGVDVGQYDAAAIPADRTGKLRRDWRVPDDARIILQAARLTGWKGQSVLIAAAGKLQQEGRLGDAVVVLAGDDQGRTSYTAGLQRQIADLGLGDRVRLAGHCSDMPAAYAAADVAVVASTEPEAFGRVAAEAQAMGCPVIATAIGAPPETVRSPPEFAADEMTGWLVPPSDPRALAACIANCLALSADARTAMSARARAHAVHSFSLAAMQRATLAVYDEILSTGLAAAFEGTAPSPTKAGLGPHKP